MVRRGGSSIAPFGAFGWWVEGEDLGGAFFFIEVDEGSALLECFEDFFDAHLGVGKVGAVTGDKFLDEATQCIGAELIVWNMHGVILFESRATWQPWM